MFWKKSTECTETNPNSLNTKCIYFGRLLYKSTANSVHFAKNVPQGVAYLILFYYLCSGLSDPESPKPKSSCVAERHHCHPRVTFVSPASDTSDTCK